jgi:iron complex transport system ATP-binding protein
VIQCEGIGARYPGASAEALRTVSLEAARGRLTAVAGPNGSGKSTIVRALLRRVPLTAGRILVDGAPLESWSRTALARRLAVVVQREEPAFPMAVSEYVTLGRHPFRQPWSALGTDDRQAVDESLAQAGVEGLRDRSTDALSGGEWQRVRIARALAQRAPALVIDEPTTFLDVGHEMACFELLASLAGAGHAVLVVSHQLNLVARFAHHVVLLSEGKVAAAGSPVEVMRGDILEAIYEWPLVITRDPAVGAPALVPLRRQQSLSPPRIPE